MKPIVAGAALLAIVAGCEPTTRSSLPDAQLSRAGCYTVELYDDPFQRNVVQPAKQGLPDRWNRFLGVWGEGAWNGGQCHEIHVTEIHQDGSVVIVDTVAPWQDLRAESHRRAGRIDGSGRLVVPGTSGPTVYVWENGRLRATRFLRRGQQMHAILNPKET